MLATLFISLKRKTSNPKSFLLLHCHSMMVILVYAFFSLWVEIIISTLFFLFKFNFIFQIFKWLRGKRKAIKQKDTVLYIKRRMSKYQVTSSCKAIICTTKLHLNALTCYSFDRGSLCARIPRILMDLWLHPEKEKSLNTNFRGPESV